MMLRIEEHAQIPPTNLPTQPALPGGLFLAIVGFPFHTLLDERPSPAALRSQACHMIDALLQEPRLTYV